MAVEIGQPSIAQAVSAIRVGSLKEASLLLEVVLVRDPNSVEALNALAFVTRRRGDNQRAAELCRRAVSLRPNDPEAQNSLGMCLLAGNEPAEAAEAFSKAASLLPASAPIHLNLGLALFRSGRLPDAARSFRRVLKLEPSSYEATLHLGRVASDPREAAGLLSKAVALRPGSAVARLLLGRALKGLDRGEEAAEQLSLCVELEPENVEALVGLGFTLQSLGRWQDASKALGRAIELDPSQPMPYFGVVQTKKVTEEDRPLIEQMESLPAKDPFIHFGLGKAYEELGQYERSMGHFDAANVLSQKTPFDRERYKASLDRSMGLSASSSNSSELPVFIVGMIRSGTTLVEQILSSHPEVGAGGELRFWIDGGTAPDPYLELLRQLGPGKRRVTDKMPHNFELLGLLHETLPGAKILHVRRSPIDNCLSIYTTAYERPPAYSHDRADIVFAYRQYQRLMDHWRSVLPEGAMLEVDYEELVTDQEPVSRRVVEFLGLEWSDACLRHHENPRTVNTPSLWQVRQPVHTGSIGRWRHFEPWLGELRELLEP